MLRFVSVMCVVIVRGNERSSEQYELNGLHKDTTYDASRVVSVDVAHVDRDARLVKENQATTLRSSTCTCAPVSTHEQNSLSTGRPCTGFKIQGTRI